MSGTSQAYSTVQQQDRDYICENRPALYEESNEIPNNEYPLPTFSHKPIVYPQSLEVEVSNQTLSIIASNGESIDQVEKIDRSCKKVTLHKPSKLSEPRMITPHNDRKKFISKVYALLTVQLLVTAIFVSIVLAVEPLRKGVKENYWIVILAWLLTIFFLLAIFFGRKFARVYPRNYIASFTFTLLQSYIVAFFCAKYDPITVVIAACLTFAVTIALTVYACKTKKDFTSMGGVLTVLIMASVCFAFLMIFFMSIWGNILVCVLISILYGVFIIYDTQLIAGGRYSELTYDDYVIGSLILYIDIVGLFIYFLSFIGKRE
jgi:FtsH-binding integral membrane protein